MTQTDPAPSPARRRLLEGAVLAVVGIAAMVVVWARRHPVEVQPPPAPEARSLEDRRALRFSQSAVDFSEVALGETREVRLQVFNAGSRPVTVLSVVIECPCLRGKMENPVLLPGGSAILRLSFTGLPGKRSYDTYASLVTDETGPSRYDLRVKGRVKQDYWIEPEVLAFGMIPRGQARTLEASIRRADGAPFELRGARFPRVGGSVEWTRQKEGREYLLRVAVQPPDAAMVADEIVLDVDPAPPLPPVILVNYQGESDVVCDPAILVATLSTGDKDLEFGATLKHRNGNPIEVEEVRESRGLPVQFRAERAEGAVKLVLVVPNAALSGLPVGEFQIRLKEEGIVLRVPYRIEGAAFHVKPK